MRLRSSVLTTLVLAAACSSGVTQQSGSTAAADQAPAQVPAPAAQANLTAGTAAGQVMPTINKGATRDQARAAEKAAKEQAKADAKAEKEAEKQQKQAAKEATYLKLQNNEIAVPRFDAEGKAVKLPPCSPKDKECQEKRKELLKEKRIGVVVQDGVLTVDGWPAKARLNYDLKRFDYIYFSVPGYGTVVVSPYRFANSIEAKDALDGQNLTIETADKRVIQLSSVANLAGKQKRSLYYSVDTQYTQPGQYASVGYGFVNHAPYAWPGALPPDEQEKKEIARAPKLPPGMQARVAVAPCPVVLTGAMSRPPAAQGGHAAPAPPPCASAQVPQANESAPANSVAAPPAAPTQQ